jgi:hypothetical protein
MSKLQRSVLFALLAFSATVFAQDATQTEAAAAAEPAAASAEAAEAAPVAAAEATTASADATATATAPAATNSLVGAPPAGKGQIVFFRPSKMMGAAIGFKVREGETELGKLRSGKYFIAAVEPGTHEYNVHGETKDVLTMEIEAGETYYVQGTLGMGIVAGRPNIAPSDEATFMGLSKKLKLAQ